MSTKKLVVSFSGHIEIFLDQVEFTSLEGGTIAYDADIENKTDEEILALIKKGDLLINYGQVISDSADDRLEAFDFEIIDETK